MLARCACDAPGPPEGGLAALLLNANFLLRNFYAIYDISDP